MGHTASPMMDSFPMVMIGPFALVAILFLAAGLFLVSRAPDRLERWQDSAAQLLELQSRAADERAAGAMQVHDTVFVLPDISNYTRFMSGSQFSHAHARYIVLSLLRAIVDAGKHRLELSKLEGDAALFYVDADRASAEELGQVLVDIFAAFFSERQRLIESNLCPCRACQHIGQLDLKAFVHRGEASRFRFQGAVDHFGAEVIVLHRIMKNSLKGKRYMMITDGALESVALPADWPSAKLSVSIEHIGDVGAMVFELDDRQVDEFPRSPHPASSIADLRTKLLANVRSVVNTLKRQLRWLRPSKFDNRR